MNSFIDVAACGDCRHATHVHRQPTWLKRVEHRLKLHRIWTWVLLFGLWTLVVSANMHKTTPSLTISWASAVLTAATMIVLHIPSWFRRYVIGWMPYYFEVLKGYDPEMHVSDELAQKQLHMHIEPPRYDIVPGRGERSVLNYKGQPVVGVVYQSRCYRLLSGAEHKPEFCFTTGRNVTWRAILDRHGMVTLRWDFGEMGIREVRIPRKEVVPFCRACPQYFFTVSCAESVQPGGAIAALLDKHAAAMLNLGMTIMNDRRLGQSPHGQRMRGSLIAWLLALSEGYPKNLPNPFRARYDEFSAAVRLREEARRLRASA